MRSGIRRVLSVAVGGSAVLMLVVASVSGPRGAVASARAGEWSTSTSALAPTTTSTPLPESTERTAPPAAPEPVAEASVPTDDESDVATTRLTVWDDATGRVVAVTVYSPATPGDATYPLVVFAHGFGSSAATYSRLERQLASSGFVVAAPDFPFTSSASGNPLDRDDVVNQAADISVVIDQLTDPSSVPDSLRGRIATTVPVGVVGHSDGGVTAAAAAYNDWARDPRVGAAVVLSGAEMMYPGSWFGGASPPLLAIHGDNDDLNPYVASQQLYADATGPKMLVTVLGGSHLGPFTNSSTEPAIAGLAADFLHAHLQHDLGAFARLDADANAENLVLAARD